MHRNLENLADALNELSWADMVKISEHISDQVTHHWKNEEPVDRDSVAQILSDMASEITREADQERVATVTSS